MEEGEGERGQMEMEGVELVIEKEGVVREGEGRKEMEEVERREV